MMSPISLVLIFVLWSIADGHPEVQKRSLLFPGWSQDTTKVGLTEKEKDIILDTHNDLRREEIACNMKTLKWDEELERVAQNWADGCDFRHNYEGDDGFKYGETLSSQTAYYNVSEMVRNWYKEKDNYNYEENACTRVCAHYTQIVSAESATIGCGMRYCQTMKTITQTQGYFLVCNYYPAINKGSSVPYEAGERCSKCPPDMPVCNNNICDTVSEKEVPTTTTPAPTTVKAIKRKTIFTGWGRGSFWSSVRFWFFK